MTFKIPCCPGNLIPFLVTGVSAVETRHHLLYATVVLLLLVHSLPTPLMTIMRYLIPQAAFRIKICLLTSATSIGQPCVIVYRFWGTSGLLNFRETTLLYLFANLTRKWYIHAFVMSLCMKNNGFALSEIITCHMRMFSPWHHVSIHNHIHMDMHTFTWRSYIHHTYILDIATSYSRYIP